MNERRSFLNWMNKGAGSLLAVAAGSAVVAKAQSGGGARWEPARHDKDDWLDKASYKHRLVFDTTTPEGLGEAMAFAGNYIRVNRTDYGLQNGDLSVVIVVRHRSTAFAYSDAIWAKYGAPMATRAKTEDPKTKVAPKANYYNSAEYGEMLPNRGTTFDALFKQGVQLAVCAVATRGVATAIVEASGGNVDAINSELIASISGNSRMVPAGIVAVNRAQERGYSLVRG